MALNVFNEIRELKEYATINKVPIMQEDGMKFMMNFVVEHNIENILEIGTAIGYSAIMMALAKKDVKITTIERDKERYMEALKNIKKFNLEDRITLIFGDALDVKVVDTYDLIFIDAAKGKNKEFFTYFEPRLKTKGFIITDNMSFHGYVGKDEKEIENRNIRGLVRKIKSYILFLEENTQYKTKFYKKGDGIAVSQRRND